MNKWRLLLFSVFGLLQITTSDRNFIDGRYSCCDHSSRYSESVTRISIYEPNRISRILPDLETRKSSETRPEIRAQALRLSSRRDINNRDHLRRINEDHQHFDRQHIRESSDDLQMTQRRDFSRERNLEYSRITRDNIRQARSVRNRDGEVSRNSRSEVASRDNYRHNDRERVGNDDIKQDSFNYRRSFFRTFVNDRISRNRKSENSPQKNERHILETSRIAKRFENRNTMKPHLLIDETRKIDENWYRSERSLKSDEVRNARNMRIVREYGNKVDSIIENRMRFNLRNNKNGIVLNKSQERHTNRDGLTEENIRLNKRSISDEHVNHARESILGDDNIGSNRKILKRNLITSTRSISDESQRYKDENRERTRDNINQNRNREDSRSINRVNLGQNRDENIETWRDNFGQALGKNSARIGATRRSTTIRDAREDVKNIDLENRFSQRTSQVRRQDTRLETSNINDRHIRNSRTFREIQERDRRDFRESRNIRMIEGRDNKQHQEQAGPRHQRRVSNIHREERDRVYSDDRRERNFIQDDTRQHRRQDRESSRMHSISVSRRIDVDRSIDNIEEQLPQRRYIRRQDRDESRARSVNTLRRYNVQSIVNEKLQRIRSRSMEERGIRKQTNDKFARSSSMANSYDFRNLDEMSQLNRYSRDAQTSGNIRRDNRDESRKVMDAEEQRSRPSLERLTIRQNNRNTFRSSYLPKSLASSNNRNDIRNEVRSGDIERSLNSHSRDTNTRQNIRRDNRDETTGRNIRIRVMENREEHLGRSRPLLDTLNIRQNDRHILRSRSTSLPKSYASSNSRDARDEVRAGNIENSFSYKRDIVRIRNTPILITARTSKNIDEEPRNTQNTLKRLTRKVGNDNSEIYNSRSLQTYISQNARNDDATRRIRSRSLTTERRTENRQVRINRDRSLHDRTIRVDRDDERRNERRDARKVPLTAATRSTKFVENIRDIPITHETKASYPLEMKWQYIFYALQGIYICSLFMKMPHNQEKNKIRITSWLTPANYMKID